jgi:hypothetical protein
MTRSRITCAAVVYSELSPFARRVRRRLHQHCDPRRHRRLELGLQRAADQAEQRADPGLLDQRSKTEVLALAKRVLGSVLGALLHERITAADQRRSRDAQRPGRDRRGDRAQRLEPLEPFHADARAALDPVVVGVDPVRGRRRRHFGHAQKRYDQLEALLRHQRADPLQQAFRLVPDVDRGVRLVPRADRLDDVPDDVDAENALVASVDVTALVVQRERLGEHGRGLGERAPQLLPVLTVGHLCGVLVRELAMQVGQRDHALGRVRPDPGTPGDHLIVVVRIHVERRRRCGQLTQRPGAERLLGRHVPLRLGLDVVGQQLIHVDDEPIAAGRVHRRTSLELAHVLLVARRRLEGLPTVVALVAVHQFGALAIHVTLDHVVVDDLLPAVHLRLGQPREQSG